MKYFLDIPWSKDDTMVLVVGFACLVLLVGGIVVIAKWA